ncbi:hypothetical protein JMA_06010 [Jeotgalibacillus malaysiensis]|uniref:Uncharacterized protein n=1 Tax=Jeotgalibacillus malaysiensis TaxID=1508404 RepID=A0A0B5AN12_9BACL|nr:hypothetical protein [Jeotgalibacillus malaysiensis]AJD89918.1 hypothetical protein JMA_06010 [Jeotgalibacillus malaysiensis]
MSFVIRFVIYTAIYFVFSALWDLALADQINWGPNAVQSVMFGFFFTMLMWYFEVKRRKREQQS